MTLIGVVALHVRILRHSGLHIVASRDKVWDREEIEAVYGVHHVYSQKKSKVCPLFRQNCVFANCHNV